MKRVVVWGLFLHAGCGSTAVTSDGQAPVDTAPAVDRFLPPEVDSSVDAADPPDASGPALGKLCHELNRGGAPATLTLEIGDGPTVRLIATTGRCAPPPATPCLAIPTGQVPVRLFEGDRLLAARTVVLMGGSEYLFQPIIDVSGMVAITGGRIAPGTCQGVDFPAPDAGAD